jgi:hypothetical protein
MGSLVEVPPHFHSSNIRDHPATNSHRTSINHNQMRPSSTAESATRSANGSNRYSTVDTPMTDAPRSSNAGLTRELAFHAAPGNTGGTRDSDRRSSSPILTAMSSARASPPSVVLRPVGSDATSSSQGSPRTSGSPPRIKVQSLSHIQSFVIDDTNPLSPSRNNSRIAMGGRDFSPQYEISDMPVAEIIEMVAGLLTKITTTNDRQHEYIDRNIPQDSNASHMNPQTSSVLAFHGKNVPSISILSYLSRIHKYCPTTYEVFLSLLIYFDRMTERVNAGPMVSLRRANQESLERQAAALGSQSTSPTTIAPPMPAVQTPPNSGSSRPMDLSSVDSASRQSTRMQTSGSPPSPPIYPNVDEHAPATLSQFFVVDSYNIHRLVIAGVTCASKFFSDIFYTNSRYAKVSLTLQTENADISGWWASFDRTEPSRASIPDSQRLSTGCAA